MAGGTLNGPAEGGGAEAASERRPTFVVRHLTGSRRGSEERFAGGSVGIGRGRTNRIALDPELDRTVSARHAEIRCEQGGLVLYDLGSLNGTYVNGRRVRRSELADGDEIGLGREGPRLMLRLERGDGAVLPPPPVEPAPAREPGPADRARRTARSDLVDPAPPPRRRRAFAVGAAVAILALAGAGWFVAQLKARLDRLESEGVGAGNASPSPAIAAASPLLVVRGALFDADGRRLSTVELGAAVHVRRRAAATSDAVLAEIRRFLAGRPGARVEVAPEGLPAAAVTVVGRRGGLTADAFAAVVLLESEHDLGAPAAGLGVGATPAELTLRRPGFPAETVRLEESLGASGARAVDAASAALLRVSGGPSVAGAALFDAAGGLRGVAAGPSRPGLYLSAAALDAACELLETSAALPLN